MTKESCASRLQQALNLRSMKQADLSQLANIPKSAISQYISGKFEPKQDRLEILAKALNVSEAWLMGYDVPMSREPIDQFYSNSCNNIEDSNKNTNIIKIAGRDGSYTERKLTDDQLDLIKKMIDQMPNAEDL